MTYADHLKSCRYCNNTNNFSELYGVKDSRPTVRIKSASSYRRRTKLSELASIIKGVSYGTILYPTDNIRSKIKGASNIDKAQKLRELGKLVKGF